MKLTSEQALDLAKLFRDVSVAVGDFKLKHWVTLRPEEQEQLQTLELTLLNLSNGLITLAVGTVLDETAVSFDNLKKATEKAKTVISNIQQIHKVLGIATAVVALAAAIPTGNPGAIAAAAAGVFSATKTDA